MSEVWTREKRLAFESAFYEFIANCYINSKDTGSRTCLGENIFEAQKRFISGVLDGLEQGIHDFWVLKSRQLGLSTISRAFTIFYLGVHDGLDGATVWDTDVNKNAARREIETMVSNLPSALRFPRIKTNNRDGLFLQNESGLRFMSAGVKKSKASGTLGRSAGLSFAHCSEMCSWDAEEGLEAFRNALSDVNPDRLYIWESTARGFNLFHEMWTTARADVNHARCLFLGWYLKPSQAIKRTDPDFERYGVNPPSEKELKRIHLVRDKYDWNITPEQLAWIRRKMDPNAASSGDADPEYEGSALKIQEQPWCVTGDTRVGTDYGILQIKDVPVGARTSTGRVVKSGPTGTAPIWRATTKLGYRLHGTANHPLINASGEQIRLDQSLGHTVKLQPPRFSEDVCVEVFRCGIIDTKATITPEFARWVGLFMGDGSAYGNSRSGYSVKITCCDEDDDLFPMCESLFVECFEELPRRKRQKSGCTDIEVTRKDVLDTIRVLGLVRNDTGPTMRRVHVPEFIWRSPKHIVKEFLSGLFEADGFNAYDTNRVSLFSKYPQFISDVQKLLLGFGITSKATSERKRSGDHEYTGNALSLRRAEAIKFNEEIGFLSRRKRNRHKVKEYDPRWANRQKPSIALEDEIISVEDTGEVEQVFNLTVEGDHLFDANGILTHNTEEEAFQMTGATFFAPEDLTNIANEHASKKFATYSFMPGTDFFECRIIKSPNARSVELKIWDEPDDEGVYVVASDVAFGINEKNDRSAIQVLRCYADGLDQVAEYAWPLINSRAFAWMIAAILGYYAGNAAEVYNILELNGPGEATWNELQSLKRQFNIGYMPTPLEEGKSLRNIFQNVRNYIYNRSDSMGVGHNWMWKTNGPLKVTIMERLRDFTSNGMLRIRSMDTLEEMKSVTREGDSIEAQGSKKDDRVFSLALGVRCWEERVRRGMMATKRTRKAEETRKKLTVVDQYQLYSQWQLQNTLDWKRTQRIKAVAQARRAAWRSR